MTKPCEFVCDCEAVTMFDYSDPVMVPVFVKVTCRGCGALWECRFRKSLRGIEYTYKIVKRTDKWSKAINQKAQHAQVNAPQKKSPIFVVPNMPKNLR